MTSEWRRVRCTCGWSVVVPNGYTVTITVHQTRKGHVCSHEVREVQP